MIFIVSNKIFNNFHCQKQCDYSSRSSTPTCGLTNRLKWACFFLLNIFLTSFFILLYFLFILIFYKVEELKQKIKINYTKLKIPLNKVKLIIINPCGIVPLLQWKNSYLQPSYNIHHVIISRDMGGFVASTEKYRPN